MDNPANGSKEANPEHKFSRRQLLIGGGAGMATVVLGALFRKEIFETISPQISIEITRLPSIPLLRFSMRPHGAIQIQPEGLQLPHADFLRIAQEFSQRISQRIDTDLLGAFKHSPPEVHPAIAKRILAEEMFALTGMHPLIRRHIAKSHQILEIPSLRFFTYVNSFLLAAGKYLLIDYDGKTPFMRVWDIHKIEEMEVIFRRKRIRFPVLFLETFPQSFNKDLYPADKMSVGAFEYPSSLISVKDELIKEREKKRVADLTQTDTGRKILGEEDGREELGDTALLNVLHHEGTHALLSVLFPKVAKATKGFEDNLQRPVTIRISSITEISLASLPPDIGSLNEFCAIGSYLAAIPRHGPYYLFYFLKTPRYQNYPYRLAYQFLLSEIAKLPNLPFGLLQKIIFANIPGSRLDTPDLEAIACHESLSTSLVNQIGEKMWRLGYGIFQSIETAIN